MLKVVLIGLTAVFLAMLAGSIRREYGYMVALGAAALIFSYGLSRISVIVTALRKLEEEIGLQQEYITVLVKMAGIAYLGQFAVSLCRDAGQVGFAAKISMLIISLPILEAVVKTIGEFFT